MRGNKRKMVVKLIDSGNLNNHLLAEYFAKKYKERKCNNGI